MTKNPCTPRIAFFLPNLEGGGAERSVTALANDLVSIGFGVDMVLSRKIGPFINELSAEVRLVDLAAPRIFDTIFQLRKYLIEERPTTVMSCLDIPNIQLVLAAHLASFRGTVALGQRGTIFTNYAQLSWLKRSIYLLGIASTYRYANVIISNSYAAAREVSALPGVGTERVVVIHNSVNIERISQLADETLCDPWLSNSDSPLILSVGSITRLKDRITLIRAFAALKKQVDARLAILGGFYDPSEHYRVLNLITEMELQNNVYLIGFDANPYRWMRRASVLVSSSITEGCPNNLLEGLALGLRIVATDCPGDSSELLQHGKWGRIVPVGDPERMAEAIRAALDDPTPPDVRIRAAEFAPGDIAARYLRVLVPTTDLDP